MPKFVKFIIAFLAVIMATSLTAGVYSTLSSPVEAEATPCEISEMPELPPIRQTCVREGGMHVPCSPKNEA